MKRTTWQYWHKWIGLFFCFFLLMFSISGIILNHRYLFGENTISRKYLPQEFHYKNWNQGLLRGSLPMKDSILIYGTSGLWLADTLGRHIQDYNKGLPQGDHRNIRAVVQTSQGVCFALGLFDLYRLNPSKRWTRVKVDNEREKWSDLIMHGDTLIAVGRSHLFMSLPPYRQFERITLPASTDYTERHSLFRLVWLLHSGELFGLPGKLFMDAIAIVLIALSITGILHWLFPKFLKRLTSPRRRTASRWMARNLRLHDWIGRKTIILTLFITLTGWCLRPPLLIPLIKFKTPTPPYTSLDNKNPWHDRLRMLRYDKQQDCWLLSTSAGFYAMPDFSTPAQPLKKTPPVSVMGVNVWQQTPNGTWIIGSFSGAFEWNRSTGQSFDALTGKLAYESTFPNPFGKAAISGYSNDFKTSTGVPFSCWVQHTWGTDLLPMPSCFQHLPMSLWNLAFELHNGRLYTFLISPSMFYIFVAGILTFIVLWSGWKVRRHRSKKQKQYKKEKYSP